MENLVQKFDLKEYASFVVCVLVLSSAIGIFYGCFGSRQKSTEEYLLANRHMSTVPVSLSLVSSFISSIALLGNPVEIYYYGLQYSVMLISFIPLTISLSYFYVPVFFNLHLSSAYQYLEMRFNKKVRIILSLLGIIHYVVYMAIVVYAPSLAVKQMTGVDVRVSTAIIFLVCIFYSSLGGLKAVLWTDALQTVIMLGCMVVVVWRGVIDIGGWKILWERAELSQRVEFFNFDIDPRVRHTFWTATIGGYFMWLPSYITQSQVQRYLSLSTLTRVRRALFLNMVGLIVIIGLCFMAGIVIVGKYHNCDPVKFGTVENSDQLLPLLVMETLGGMTGFPGLFVAGIISASLSSVSSGLSAIASIMTYDYVNKWAPNVSDENLSRISKLLCVAFGLVSYGFIFLTENMGNIIPATSTLVGVMLGPSLGIFTLGMFFPWTNAKGSLMGLVLSFLLMISLVVGASIASYQNLLPDQRLYLTTEGCGELYNATTTMPTVLLPPFASPDIKIFQLAQWKSNESTWLINILSISCIWYPLLGCCSTVILGLLFSILFAKLEEPVTVNPDLISPPVLWLLCKLLPTHMGSWIEPIEHPILLSRSSYSLGLRQKVQQYTRQTSCDIQIKRISISSFYR